MILHCVFLRLAEGHHARDLSGVMAGLAALQPLLDGFEAFEDGPNRDFEGKSAGFPAGFVCRFRDAEALAAYADDPRHRALGARLVALCDGGAEGIMVFDIDTSADRPGTRMA